MNPFTALKNLSQCCEDRYDPGSWKMDQRCSTNYVLLPSFNCPETESNNLWFSISAQLFTLRERCIQRMFCVAVRWLAVSRRGPLQLLETYWVQSMTFGRGRSGGLQARNFVMKGPVRRSSSIGPVRTSSNIGPVRRSSSIGPVRRSSGLGPVRRSSSIGPVRMSSSIGPVRRSSSIGPVRKSSSIGPVRRSSSIGPVSVCVIHNVGCFLVVMWKHMLPHHHDWLLRILTQWFLKFSDFNEAPTNSLRMIYWDRNMSECF